MPRGSFLLEGSSLSPVQKKVLGPSIPMAWSREGARRRRVGPRWLLASLGLALLLHGSVAAAESPAEGRRPRIGLALSGGGARGCAHVGVLKVLEEMHIPVDYIAGTSMGAIVGGLYASGLSASEVEEILSTIDWQTIAEDEQPRRDRAYRRKEDDQRYLMNLEIGLDGFVLPRGLRSGQRFTFELQRYTWPAAGIRDFSELPVPFKAVAVDLETGDRVLLDRGSLPLAMRASMSIPGVFTPVELDGRLLVDGGIVANLPIDVVRDMGADIVIAVDIGDRLVGRDELGSMLAVTTQAMTISSSQSVTGLLETADVVLTPEVGGRGTLDFSDVRGIIGEGEAEARRRADLLADLALSEEEYARHRARQRLPAPPPWRVSRVELTGLERVDERIVRRVMETRPGEPLQLEVLRRDLERIYGLGDFELVEFDAVPEEGGLAAVVRVKEKRGGPFFFRSALNLDVDEDQNSEVSFLLNVTAIRLNKLGLEWRTDARLGTQQRLESELYQPLDLDGHWFVAAGVAYRRELFNLFETDRPVGELERLTNAASLSFGRVLDTSGELRVAAFRERREQNLESGPKDLGGPEGLEETVDTAGWQVRLSVDRLDSIYFPRAGQLGSLAVVLSRPELGADDRYELLGLNHVGAKSWGRHTLLSWLELGTSLGDDQPASAFFGGGGLFSFSGYRRGELFGATFAVLRPTYFYRLASLPTVVGKGLYLGGWLEAGNFWQSQDDASLDDLRYAATVTLGAETALGPAYLAVGLAEGGRRQVTLSIGPSFSTGPR